jgi:hypothetical protein
MIQDSSTPVAEVWVRRTTFRRSERWRWQITWYQPTAPTHPGVYNGRLHIRSNHGYTLTRAGAWRRLGRVYHQSLVAQPGVRAVQV